MDTAINIVMIIVSILLMGLILLQSNGSAFQSDSSSMHRTRRGVERTIFNMTIIVSGVFVLMAIVSSFT